MIDKHFYDYGLDFMKKLILALSLLSLSLSANANCYGTSTMYRCYDANSGNSYNVLKSGNMTYVNGYNSNTGSTWSSNSHTIGNMTIQNGYDKDGNSWNQTINRMGSYTSYSGTDSDGNYYHTTCGTYGCF